MARTTARVDGATLVLPESDVSPITLDTPAWFAWLEHATTFAFTSPCGHFTARKERQARGSGYWKAYRTSHGTLHRVYLGKAQDLTLDRLNQAAATLVAALTPAAPLPAVCTAARPAPTAALSANLLATKLFVPPARSGWSPEVQHAYTAFSVTPRYFQTYLVDEGTGMSESFIQAGAVKTFGDLPLIVLSRGLDPDQDWQAMQTELLHLSSHSQQVFADKSGHNIQLDQPEAATAAIVQMVAQLRQP